MIWRRAAQPAPAEPPAPPSTPLADDVWAARARSGPVPAGWVGLRVSDDGLCLAWARHGEPVPAPRKGEPLGTVWWLREEHWSFRFAPWPHMAPEAGLEATLCLDCPPDADRRAFLARALAQLGADKTGERWAAEWATLPVLRDLPPCPPPDLLADRARALEHCLHLLWQVRVLGLRRVDLALPAEEMAEVVPEAVPEPAAAPEVLPDALPVAANEAPQAAELPPLQPHGGRPAPAARDLRAHDAWAWGEVARELPRLLLALEQRWAGGGWSADAGVAQRQRAIVQRLGLMAGTLGALPAVGHPARGSSGPTAAQRSLLWAQAGAALEALARARLSIERLPVARQAPAADDLVALDDAVQALQQALHVRLHPYWE